MNLNVIECYKIPHIKNEKKQSETTLSSLQLTRKDIYCLRLLTPEISRVLSSLDNKQLAE